MLQLIHEDPNLVVSLNIKLSIRFQAISLGSQRNFSIRESRIFLFWPRTSFTFRASERSRKLQKFTKFLLGVCGGCGPRSPGPDARYTEILAQLADLVRRPRRVPPHVDTPRGALASGPGRRPDVPRRVHSPSASPRPLASPPGEAPTLAPPHR